MGFLEARDLSNVPLIPEYYKGKTIFITGGSGFMGKVLIEKLVYSCPDLDRIYLLMRNKKGVKSEDRLARLYASACFNRLRAERPGVFQSKVFVIAGDLMDVELGLSEEDRALLINRVNIIFHVAASVRFNDPLSQAVKMNLRGTKDVIELAKDIKELSAMVHVSTCYSNTNHNPIEEVMYPPLADWRETLDICNVIDEHTLKVLTPKYMRGMPNTYVFTKQLAEHVVYEQKGKLPIVIIRPSIVMSSVSEPMPGWIDTINGPVGLTIAGAKGILRSSYTDPDIMYDAIPVDVCIKNFVAAAWIRGTKNLEDTDDITIYNSCIGNLNRMTLGQVTELGRRLVPVIPFNSVLWAAGGSITTNQTWHYIKVLFLHLLPALFVDLILWISGHKTLLVKVQRRIFIATQALGYYVTRSWTFHNKNFVFLRSCIKDEDKKDFYYEVESVDKYEFFRKASLGAREYLLNEKSEDIPMARKNYFRMQVLDKLVQSVFYGFLFWWILNTNFIHNVYHRMSDFER